MSDDVLFVIDEARYRHTFQSHSGPVGRDLAQRCRRLETLAVTAAGFDTGVLVASITTVFTRESDGDIGARVGANPAVDEMGYFFWHHEGTDAHHIYPRKAKALRFPDRRRGGAIVFRHSVYHPGTRPNRYLTQFLREVF